MPQVLVNSGVDAHLCHLGKRVFIKQERALNRYLFKGTDPL